MRCVIITQSIGSMSSDERFSVPSCEFVGECFCLAEGKTGSGFTKRNNKNNNVRKNQEGPRSMQNCKFSPLFPPPSFSQRKASVFAEHRPRLFNIKNILHYWMGGDSESRYEHHASHHVVAD